MPTTPPDRNAIVIPLEKALERRSEVWDLLARLRRDELQEAIESGRLDLDLETIADGVINDIDQGKK